MAIIHNMLSHQSQLQYLQMLVPHYGWTLGMISPWGNSSISAWNINSKRERKELCFLSKVSPEYNFIIPGKCSSIPPSPLLFFPIIISTTRQWQGPPLSLENYCCLPKSTQLAMMLAADHMQYHPAFNLDTETTLDWGIVAILRVSDSRMKISV